MKTSLRAASPCAKLPALVVPALALALLLGGCASISIPMGGMGGLFESDDDIVTGSVAKQPPPALPDADRQAAAGAITLAMTRPDIGASVPWQNPTTGAHGNITPLAADPDSAEDGLTCRAFLMSYVRIEAQSWHQGEACNAGKGGWQVRNLRPLSEKL